jgi:tetratricopeptide (TPR) repeat protein
LPSKKNKKPEALKYFEQAANTLPEFVFQEDLVRFYQKQGQVAKAEETLAELLAGMEEDQEAGHIVDLELANIHLELKKDYNQALEYALKEYKRRPNNIDVNKTLANVYYHLKDFLGPLAISKKPPVPIAKDAD